MSAVSIPFNPSLLNTFNNTFNNAFKKEIALLADDDSNPFTSLIAVVIISQAFWPEIL